MNPTSTYRMSPQIKAHLSLAKFKTPEQRAEWKKAMIAADLEQQKKVVIKSKED